jgi:hypothetical protein
MNPSDMSKAEPGENESALPNTIVSNRQLKEFVILEYSYTYQF